jgi:Flp pilus assembly pilin Flp
MLAAALIVAIVALAIAAAVASRGALQRRRKWRWAYVGSEVYSARVGDTVSISKLGKCVRIAAVDVAAGAVEVEPVTPPSAAKRGAITDERALLLAFGFDPKTHDVLPVTGGTHRGMQVLRDGERVRFFTEKQVKARLRQPGTWKQALREARA